MSSSTVLLGLISNLFARTFATLGDRKPGSVGPSGIPAHIDLGDLRVAVGTRVCLGEDLLFVLSVPCCAIGNRFGKRAPDLWFQLVPDPQVFPDTIDEGFITLRLFIKPFY